MGKGREIEEQGTEADRKRIEMACTEVLMQEEFTL